MGNLYLINNFPQYIMQQYRRGSQRFLTQNTEKK